MQTRSTDQGAVRLVSATWLVVILAVLGVVGYNTASVASTRMSVEDDAQNAAYAASESWHDGQNYDAALQAAVTALNNPSDTIVGPITFDPDGTAHLVVERPVTTFLINHIGDLKHFDSASEHGDANAIT